VVQVAQRLHRRRYENVAIAVERAPDDVGCDVVVNATCEGACEDVAPRTAWSSAPATL